MPYLPLLRLFNAAHFDPSPKASDMFVPTITLAALSDRAAIVALMQRAYRGEESRQGWTSEADLIDGERISLDAIDSVLNSPHHRLLIAKDSSNQLVGCADIEHISEAPSTCSFGKFAVEPRLQGGGVGKILLEAAEAEAHARVFGNADGHDCNSGQARTHRLLSTSGL
jgi:GNAT superfamily N-acetyltransferase